MTRKFTTILMASAILLSLPSYSKGKKDREREAQKEEQIQLTASEQAIVDAQNSVTDEQVEEETLDQNKRLFGGRIDFDKIGSKLNDVLQTTSVEFGAKFLDLQLGGTSVGAKYRFEDKPSYIGGNYTRADLWRLELNTNVLEFFQEPVFDDISVNPYVDIGINMFFARQHQEERPEGLAQMPLFPNQIPLTAERALKTLQIDDFFALPTHVDIGMRVGYRNPVASSVTVGGNFYYRIGRADLMINVFRETEKTFNIKVIGIKRKGHGAFGYVDLFYGLTGNEKFDDFLMDDVIGTNIFSIQALSSEVGDLHISDYTVDLTNPKAADAYEQMFKKMFTIQRLKLLNPFVKKARAKELIADIIQPIEDLATNHKEAARRNFVGSFAFNNDPFNIRVGNKIAKYERNTNYVENRVKYVDADGKPVYFLNTYFSYNKKVSFLWSLIKSTRERTSSMILFTDDKYQVVEKGLSDYRITDQHTDQWAFAGEQRDLKERIEGNIGKTISAQVPWDDFLTDDKQDKLRVRVELIVDNAALYAMRESNAVSDIREKLDAYLYENNDFSESILSLPIINWFSGRSSYHRRRIAETLMEGLSEQTYVAIKERESGFNRNNTPHRTKTRYELARNYVLLEKMSLFKNEGLGFIMSLLEASGVELEDKVYVKLTWSSDEKDEQTFVYGTYPESSQIYNTLEYALSILGGRTFDIRTIRDSTFKANLTNKAMASEAAAARTSLD